MALLFWSNSRITSYSSGVKDLVISWNFFINYISLMTLMIPYSQSSKLVMSFIATSFLFLFLYLALTTWPYDPWPKTSINWNLWHTRFHDGDRPNFVMIYSNLSGSSSILGSNSFWVLNSIRRFFLLLGSKNSY
jgi:hypothetical protein